MPRSVPPLHACAKRALTATLAVAGALALVLAAGPARAVAKTHVTYTSRTVFVKHRIAARQLVSLSADRTTFVFRHAVGPLKRLRRGKVMVLVGADARVVRRVRHRHRRLVVTTRPAALTDIVRSGHIAFSGRPNMDKAFLIQTGAFRSAHAGRALEPPAYPYVGRPARVLRATASGSPATFGGGGSFGKGQIFGFNFSFSHPSSSRLNMSGTICLQLGPVCSTGPATGLSAEVTVSGHVDVGQADVGIDVSHSKVEHASVGVSHLAVDGTMKYVISRGTGGDENADPPVIHLPIGAGISVPGPGGVPLYFTVQVGMLLKLGVSSHQAVIRGGAQVSTTGSDKIATNGKRVTTSGSADSVQATVLGHAQTGLSESAAPSGTVVAVQFPKLGFGLGTTAVHGMGFVDVVSSVGQTVGAAYAGLLCSSYDLYVDVDGGFEAQIGPLISTKKWPLMPQKHYQLTEPGCASGFAG